MAEYIRITEKEISEIVDEFKAKLSEKISDGKITFTKTLSSVKRKATLYFTEEAFQKMKALVDGFDGEVAWHGLAQRGADESLDEYFVYDILVYPQEVTGATVTTDQTQYEKWLCEQKDEVFNNIRMQGHSHVNMSTSPSSVDTSLYDRILDQLEDDMFYIFMIWNKRSEKMIMIYDMKKNILFKTSDITVTTIVQDPPQELGELSEEETKAAFEYIKELRFKKERESFAEASKEMVKQKTYTSTYLSSMTSVPDYKKTEEAKKEPETGKTPEKKKNGKKRKGRRPVKVQHNASYEEGYPETMYDDPWGYEDPYSYLYNYR